MIVQRGTQPSLQALSAQTDGESSFGFEPLLLLMMMILVRYTVASNAPRDVVLCLRSAGSCIRCCHSCRPRMGGMRIANESRRLVDSSAHDAHRPIASLSSSPGHLPTSVSPLTFPLLFASAPHLPLCEAPSSLISSDMTTLSSLVASTTRCSLRFALHRLRPSLPFPHLPPISSLSLAPPSPHLAPAIPMTDAQLDKEQLRSLLCVFRLLTVEDVVVAAAHRVRCDEADEAEALYAQLQRALEGRQQRLDQRGEEGFDDAPRFLPVVAGLSGQRAAEWLELLRLNQADLLALRSAPSPPFPPPPASDPQPATDTSPSPAQSPPDADDPSSAAEVTSGSREGKRSAHGRRRVESARDASSAAEERSEVKRRRVGKRMPGAREAMQLQQEVAHLIAMEDIVAERRRLIPPSSASAPPPLLDAASEDEDAPLCLHQDGDDVVKPHDLDGSDASQEAAAGALDAGEVGVVDNGREGMSSAAPAAVPVPSTVSRWQRPRRRLVRFRLVHNGDEQRQLEAQEAEYFKEVQAGYAPHAATDAIQPTDEAEAAVQEEDTASTVMAMEAEAGAGVTASSDSSEQ